MSGISLYLIEILHQTTTGAGTPVDIAGLYLIEILHQTTTRASTCVLPSCCILSKFYIKPQHGSIRTYNWGSCILSKFYIKPQLRQGLYSAYKGCILSKFYIKPQRSGTYACFRSCCILSKFYIKPQPSALPLRQKRVVSYRNSTSNHNAVAYEPCFNELYLIEILHQTTTQQKYALEQMRCILSKFYIKPQLRLERELSYCVVSYRNSTSNHNNSISR